MLPTTEFIHVTSEENPADLCSRGLLATQLVAQQKFWFQGPSWLGSSFPDQPQTLLTKEEVRQEVKSMTVLPSPSNSLVNLESFNSLVRLLRTLCICKVSFKKDLKMIFGREEMALALCAVVKADQMVHFEAEFKALSNGESINPKSSIAPLYPFMDNGVITVDGRLAHGYSMTDDQLFPLLVSHRSKKAYTCNQRCPQTNPSWWSNSNSGRDETSNLGHSGIDEAVSVYQKVRHVLPLQLMANFAGPLSIKNGTECVKGYVAVFICFASKAVHLEAVSSLTSDAMVTALRRFIARRGIPSQIVSDNATNFVGARRDINELEKVVRAGAQSYSSIEWLFIPPRSPNFGGLGEAAVESIKHHLRRVMGNSILNYEEMTTIFCQIEQVLNNRPLMALTNNPYDIFAITPSMLVNGSRLDPVKRFRSIQQLLSQFWKRWSSEYVASLQPRSEWRQARANLSVDDVVLITDDGIRPLRWSIGRVMQLKLGRDGLA